MKNPREVAMHILYDVEFMGAYSNMALKSALETNDLKSVDKAFITRLVYGVIKRRLTLEYVIKQNSKIKLKKISKYILIILQMGIYQLKFMDKVPESAAVNESVKLAKRYGHSASSGFVNGVLHSVIRNELTMPLDKFEAMSVEYSYPVELCKKWCADFGEEFSKELMYEMNTEPEMSLRVNTIKTTSERIVKENENIRISDLYENALICSGFDVAQSEIYKNGYIYPQDISAMMASVVLNPKEGERVLDMCAAPGGKTTHIAQLMKNQGEIVACDIHEHKLELIDKNAKRLGINIIKSMLCDASIFNKEFENSFDKVLCDVPCSGLGIIKRKPDIKWKTENFDDLIKKSKQILTNAIKYVKIGGEVVFSTCTINREENEERLFELLEENNDIETVDIRELLPKELQNESAKKGYVTFYPNLHGIDGFFIAKIKRCR